MLQNMSPDPYQPIGSKVSSLWAILLYMVGGDLLYERKVSGIIIDYRCDDRSECDNAMPGRADHRRERGSKT